MARVVIDPNVKPHPHQFPSEYSGKKTYAPDPKPVKKPKKGKP